MTRFLLASMPAAGHVGPLVPVARELVARGHEVAWYTGAAYRDKAEAAGAAYLPFVAARDLDLGDLDAQLPGRASKRGLARFRFDMREVFIAAVPGQVADLERHATEFAPDVIVAEPSMAAAARVLHDRRGIPWATCGITAYTMPSADTAPFGLGLMPGRTALGRARNRALAALIDRTLFRAVDRDFEATRVALGLGEIEGGLFGSTMSPYLYLQPTVPEFEYPRRDLPPQVHFVGPLLPPVPAGFEPPAWWGDVTDGRPVVLVTQGTVATDPEELLLPALEALRHEHVQVVAVTGGPDPADLPAPPPNARVERYVPFGALMPHVRALVTNGGYGGLHFALSHGVPLVVVGATEEKPELVARTNWTGVGVGLRRQRARPRELRRAVAQVLDRPEYGARAAALAAEMGRYGGPRTAAALLEDLAASGRPVLQPDARPRVLMTA